MIKFKNLIKQNFPISKSIVVGNNSVVNYIGRLGLSMIFCVANNDINRIGL